MKKIQLLLGLLFISFIPFYSCTNDENSNNEDFSIAKNIQNVSYGTNSQQVFDLYLPANRNQNTKTLILVHGGGWIEGDKADMSYLVPIIQQNFPNYAVANINYRLASSGNYAFPMQINDIDAIISKLKSTESYGISDNFGFIGTSAGGHLSLLYSYTKNDDNHIKMVASIVGPTNFTDINYTNNPLWIINYYNLTGVNYFENPAYFEQLSPLHRATTSSIPTIMFYGNADELIPTTQGESLRDKLTQLGVYNEFNLYNGGHGTWSTSDILDANLKLIAFIRNQF